MSTPTLPRAGTTAQPTLMDSSPKHAPQSLVRHEPAVPSLIRTPQDLNARLAEWQDRYRVLSPVSSSMGGFLEGYALTASIVRIDPYIDPASKRGHDTYFNRVWMELGKDNNINGADAERALALIGLTKITKGAGIRWDPTFTRRLDDGRRRYYWEFRAFGEYRTPDGDINCVDASVSHDVRDGSAEIGYWTPDAWLAAVKEIGAEAAKKRFHDWTDRRVLQERMTGHRKCESKAKNAAARGFGVAHIYTVKELLERPFLVLKTVYLPDMSNPDVAMMVTAHALGGSRALYPHTTPALPPAPVRDDRLADEGGADDEGDETPRSREAASSASDTAPLTSEPIRVVAVAEKTGTTNGRKWTVYVVSFSDGQSAATFDAKLAAFAQQLQADQSDVDPSIEDGQKPGTYKLLELRRVKPKVMDEEPPLAFDDDAGKF